jgi:hypothetical protein
VYNRAAAAVHNLEIVPYQTLLFLNNINGSKA